MKKGIKKQSKIKTERIKISKSDYDIIAKIINIEDQFNFLARDKIGRLSKVDRMLLEHLSDDTKKELLHSKLSSFSLDDIEYIHLLVFFDNAIIT